MFDVGLLALLSQQAGIIEPAPLKIEHPIELAQLGSTNAQRSQILKTYLAKIREAGFSPERQGIWMQTGDRLLEMNGGDTLHSGASLTKAATTLAVIHHYDLDHRFSTQISHTGQIVNGILQGDLIIDGGMDLLLMPSEAIAFGNWLEAQGITKVAGNLITLFPHANALPAPEELGQTLREGMNAGLWSEDTLRHYQQHLGAAPKPAVEISGSIQAFSSALSIPTVLKTHESPTVLEMVKYMNLHSSNDLAEAFTADIGGIEASRQLLLSASNLPDQEIQLQNGSGLGVSNRMTPRSVVGIFIAIQDRLSGFNLDLKDAFPESGTDIGTLEDRQIPRGAVVKTGTLWNVSALAGYIPTETQGRVWFAIMNEGGDYVDGFRRSQDTLLNQMVQHLALNAS